MTAEGAKDVDLRAFGAPLTIAQTSRGILRGDLSSVDLTRQYLARIEQVEPYLNAFITVLPGPALETAALRDAERSRGIIRGPLHGIPIVLKDLIGLEGSPTTFGSTATSATVSSTDATVVRHLKSAGCIIIGKTNLNAFAAGLSGRNPFFGDTRSPWDFERSPGGSSSGTGAAVAARLCSGGLGTDTGGSIRVPASWLGIAGLRPTHGLISLNGIFPRSPSFDTVGPLARTVEDLALLLDGMSSQLPSNPQSSQTPPPRTYSDALQGGMNGVRLGLVADYAFRDLDADVESSFNEALRLARSLGAVIEPLKLDTVSDYQDVETAFSEILSYEFNRIITSVYGSNDWERLLGPTGTLDAENGSRVTQRKYEARLAEKVGITADLRKVFRTVDALICPATPHTAPFLHSDLSVFERARQFAVPFSYAGLPAIVVPCGLSREGFPVGLQIVGDRYEERRLLHIAKAFEDALDFRALPTVI